MIGTTDLCNDNVENEIKFEFFRNESSGTHVNLGVFSTTLGVLKTPCPPGQTLGFPITKKGNFKFVKLRFDKKYSFLEYVFGGCDIDLSIAIDFTLSNGAPNDP
jgi:hypothetical protein